MADQRPAAPLVELEARRAEFLEWWVTPEAEREPKTIAEWAERHGVHRDTPKKWRRDASWQKALEQRLAELNVTPDRLQRIIDTLYEKACDRFDKQQVQAAQLYMTYVDKLKPTRIVVDHERDASDLSDEELASAMEAEVVRLRSVK